MADFALIDRKHSRFSASGFLFPLRAIWNGLFKLALLSPYRQALVRLGQMSDEDLAAQGLTRQGELRRIMGPRMV